jgi:hypothetical protein
MGYHSLNIGRMYFPLFTLTKLAVGLGPKAAHPKWDSPQKIGSPASLQNSAIFLIILNKFIAITLNFIITTYTFASNKYKQSLNNCL